MSSIESKRMQEPEAQTGVFQRASNLVDAAVSDRTVGSHHIGDMSNTERVLVGLDIRSKA